MEKNEFNIDKYDRIIFFNISIKNLWKFIRINYKILIFLPTLIGGIYQLFKLIQIDIQLVRFFSITQLISDGLLILITVFAFIFIPFVIYTSHGKYNSIVDAKKADKFNDKENVYLAASIFLFSVLAIFFYKFYYKFEDTFALYFFAVYIMLFDVYLFSAYKVFIKKDSIPYNLINYKLTSKKKWLKYLTYFAIFSFTLLILRIIDIKTSSTFSNNLKNTQNIERILKDKYGIEKYEISFFNDKFIFVESLEPESFNKNKKDIVILKFESLF